MHAYELRDVYKPHRPSPVARLNLVSSQYTLCLVDALEDSHLAFPLGDIVARFTMSGKPPLRAALPSYTHTVELQFYIWGSTAVWPSSPTLRTLSYP
jgi:hypothetical protein